MVYKMHSCPHVDAADKISTSYMLSGCT
jgi:hypothetical protein